MQQRQNIEDALNLVHDIVVDWERPFNDLQPPTTTLTGLYTNGHPLQQRVWCLVYQKWLSTRPLGRQSEPDPLLPLAPQITICEG